ncbi:hypothetical protein BD311DRAFT_766999 [Dichomitus squalens]|uniref:BTB domain-containing protein n=1 Tax=Dichomitus squalens TaxID=114155 RepID=A0A4Q9MCV3_9APHY|nr:hypothetical protein BD311DRAFT_766999 [Dichomitus squalens]
MFALPKPQKHAHIRDSPPVSNAPVSPAEDHVPVSESDMVPVHKDDASPEPEERPVPENGVSVSEDSETMDTFLRVCYPHTAAQIEVGSLSHLHKVLAAGQKYISPPVVDAMRRTLVQPRFLDNGPLHVFAVACALDLEEEAKEAAKTAVSKGRVPVKEDVPCPEMDTVSAGAYHRLIRLQQAFVHQGRIDFSGIEPICRGPPQYVDQETVETPAASSFTSGDTVLRTSDTIAIDYTVHLQVIQLASPRMLQIIARDQPQREPGTAELPVYIMRERSAIVGPLLRFCYPGKHPRFTDSPDLFLEVLAALKKYELNDAADEAVQAYWMSFAEKDPFRFFFHAVALRLADEVRSCARLIAESPSGKNVHSLYVPEMESAGSLAYRRLLSYVGKHRNAATQHLQFTRERPCHDDQCACRTRCPTGISTHVPSSDFRSVFQKIKDMLDKRPCGKAFTGDMSLVGLVMDGMHAQSTLAQVSSPGGYGGGQWGIHGSQTLGMNYNGQYPAATQTPPLFFCSMSDRLEWASGLLQSYADAVDRGISQVELDLSGIPL